TRPAILYTNPAHTDTYTLSLHDALPISGKQLVRHAAVIPSDEPDGSAEEHRNDGGDESDQNRHPAAVDHELQDIESLPVRPEGMGTRGRLHRDGPVELRRIRSDEYWCGDRDEDEKQDDHEPGRGELVMEAKHHEFPESGQIERETFAERRGPPARFGGKRRRQVSRLPNPRVEVHVQDIRDRIRDDDAQGGYEEHPGEEREVSHAGGVPSELPEARNV